MMKNSKFWIAVVAGGVVANILDFVVQGKVFADMYYSKMPEHFNMTANPAYYILGDFVAVLVFAWVYDKVYASFGGGRKGGMMFGVYAGVLVNFPTWIFAHLTMVGVSYGMSWMLTIYGVAWYTIVGTVVGQMYSKS